MSERIHHDVGDVFFTGSVTNIHNDGQDRVNRFRQEKGTRFRCYEEHGWLYFVSRRTIMVSRNHIACMEPMTEERAKALGPNPVPFPAEAKKAGGK